MEVRVEGSRIILQQVMRKLWIEPWGPDGIRVRMTNDAAPTRSSKQT